MGFDLARPCMLQTHTSNKNWVIGILDLFDLQDVRQFPFLLMWTVENLLCSWSSPQLRVLCSCILHKVSQMIFPGTAESVTFHLTWDVRPFSRYWPSFAVLAYPDIPVTLWVLLQASASRHSWLPEAFHCSHWLPVLHDSSWKAPC